MAFFGIPLFDPPHIPPRKEHYAGSLVGALSQESEAQTIFSGGPQMGSFGAGRARIVYVERVHDVFFGPLGTLTTHTPLIKRGGGSPP